jgi:hypothetical protein
MQITVALRANEAAVLRKLAANERRTPRAQAAYIIAKALNQQNQEAVTAT